MRHVLLAVVLVACSKSTGPAPQAATNDTAPIHETQSLPTSSAPEPIPTVTSTVAPIPPTPTATATAAASASTTKPGKLTKDECGKLVRKFAENVASDKGGELKEGFEKIPIYQTMVDDCVANGTRTQYDCVMKSKTMQDWLGCMR